MNTVLVRASYACAALSAGLLALHFNAEQLPAWTTRLSLGAAALAFVGAACAAAALGRQGWTSLRHRAGQIALAINGFFAIAFAAYALAPDLLQ